MPPFCFLESIVCAIRPVMVARGVHGSTVSNDANDAVFGSTAVAHSPEWKPEVREVTEGVCEKAMPSRTVSSSGRVWGKRTHTRWMFCTSQVGLRLSGIPHSKSSCTYYTWDTKVSFAR